MNLLKYVFVHIYVCMCYAWLCVDMLTNRNAIEGSGLHWDGFYCLLPFCCSFLRTKALTEPRPHPFGYSESPSGDWGTAVSKSQPRDHVCMLSVPAIYVDIRDSKSGLSADSASIWPTVPYPKPKIFKTLISTEYLLYNVTFYVHLLHALYNIYSLLYTCI